MERDYIPLGDGSALAEGTTCTRCGQCVTLFRGVWWSDGDDSMCPDGESAHVVGAG